MTATVINNFLVVGSGAREQCFWCYVTATLIIAAQSDCATCVGKFHGAELIGSVLCGGGAVTKLTVCHR